MARKVHALYDFEAQHGTGELAITAGEILTVTRTDVGEGWWEGCNSKGETGLFPEAYVEDYSEDEAPPAMAPPPLPPDYGSTSSAGGWAVEPVAPAAPPPKSAPPDDDWGWNENSAQTQRYSNEDPWSSSGAAPSSNNDNNYNQAGSSDPFDHFDKQPPGQQQQSSSANTNQVISRNNDDDVTQAGYDQDDWDSDFDDDNGGPTGSTMTSNNQGQTGTSTLNVPRSLGQSGSTGDVSSIGRADSRKISSKTSFNRFSPFVKSGGESYVLGKLNANVQEADIIQVVDNGDGKYSWLNVKPPYSCILASPKKESKLKGLKSFIAYQLTPSFSNIPVPRRYKHFDWLHERLVEKYTFIPIPPLPDKQIQGRYENEFIDHRMNQLQSFVDRVCRHPILSQSEVWQHFLTCTDDKRWKVGKRKAEKDPLIGGNIFMAIRTPSKQMDASFIEKEVDVFTKFTGSLDAAVKNMLRTSADQTQKCQNHYKREYQTIGKAFIQLGSALQQDGNYLSTNLNNAITCTGEAYEEIGKMFDDQPRNDWEHLGDMMHDYRGLLGGWPSILQIHAGAVSKKREFDKIGGSEAVEISSRTDTLSYGLLAEINTFHQQRNKDMKTAHQHFLQEQIAFYQKITEKLQDSLRMFDNC